MGKRIKDTSARKEAKKARKDVNGSRRGADTAVTGLLGTSA